MGGGQNYNNSLEGCRPLRGELCSLGCKGKYQALDNLKQLLHHYSYALVTKETADGLEVRRADKVSVGAIYVGVGNVQRLRKKQRNGFKLGQKEKKFSLTP